MAPPSPSRPLVGIRPLFSPSFHPTRKIALPPAVVGGSSVSLEEEEERRDLRVGASHTPQGRSRSACHEREDDKNQSESVASFPDLFSPLHPRSGLQFTLLLPCCSDAVVKPDNREREGRKNARTGESTEAEAKKRKIFCRSSAVLSASQGGERTHVSGPPPNPSALKRRAEKDPSNAKDREEASASLRSSERVFWTADMRIGCRPISAAG